MSGSYSLYDLIIETPEELVKTTLNDLNRGKETEHLDKEQVAEINRLIESPKEYDLPGFVIDFSKRNYDLGENLNQVTIISKTELSSNLCWVFVTFNMLETNKNTGNVNSYLGKVYFKTKKESWNSWKISDMKITEIE